MKIFCRILIYIIMAGTLSGCGGGSDGSSSSNTDPSYPSYSHPDPPSSNIDPPSNSSSDPAPSICKDDAKNCLASSLPDTIYVTKDETELYVVNNSSNPITINKVAFSDGGTTNTLSGLSIDTEKYPNSHNGDFKLPYKIYGITTIYGYYYKCYINIIVTQNYSNNSSTYILVDYTTKGGKHKTSSIKISIALEKNKQPPPSGNDSQYKKYNDYQEKNKRPPSSGNDFQRKKPKDLGVKEQLENINQLDDEIEKNEKNNSTTNLTKNINDLKEDLMNYIALNSLSGKDFCLNLTDKPLDIKKIQSEAENKFVKIKELVEKIEKNDLTKNLTEKLDELKENLKDYMVLNFPNIENCIKTGNDNARNNIQTIRSEVEEKFAYIKELGEEIEKNTPAYKLNEDSKELKRKLVEYIASDSLPVSDYLYKSNYNEYYYNQDKLYYEKTYYKILGIPYEEKFSTNKQRSKTIKKNYNKLCLICHPDKKIADNETLVKALRKIQGIYEWLEKYSNGWVPNHVA